MKATLLNTKTISVKDGVEYYNKEGYDFYCKSIYKDLDYNGEDIELISERQLSCYTGKYYDLDIFITSRTFKYKGYKFVLYGDENIVWI